ncbi:MAG TPA: ATP-binding protein [Mucilaginibacter sp.]|nr:ATP-binding protein [Mucilaginibacter sp.]
MKYLLKLFLLLLPAASFSQDLLFNLPSPKEADSLLAVLKHTTNDTLKMSAADHLSNYYIETNTSLAYQYFTQALTLARKLDQKLTQASALDGLSYVAYKTGDFAESLQFAQAGIAIAENANCEQNVWRVTQYAKDGNAHKARLYILANLYEKLAYLNTMSGNNHKALSGLFKALAIAESVDDKVGMSFYYGNLARLYIHIGKPDSAILFAKKAIFYCDQSGYELYKGYDIQLLGSANVQKGDHSTGKKLFLEALKVDKEQNNLLNLPFAALALGEAYSALGKTDSGIYYEKSALKDFKDHRDNEGINLAYNALYRTYKSAGSSDSAYIYLQYAKTFGDSLNEVKTSKFGQYLNAGFDNQLKVQQLEKEKIATQSRNRIYVLLAGIAVLVLISLIFYRNNRQKQKANILLNQQKEEVQNALAQLKAAQTQLIQSEKMASLGELTAGIAHEIQNPLNFVNNFSDLSTELVDEMQAELKNGDKDEAIAISEDIKQNLEKIRHHGKRADFIVKGMLEHSRTGTGQRQETNINVLADEFLKLSHHGLQAKDKNFNADMVTNFDAALPRINIVQQDIGRVLVNLYNNAFYAVNQKAKGATENYKPTVEVSTRQQNGSVIISVKDNGNGIPNAIKDKIMQPFFTTKPTGEGTGLGLSLSYDIIVKGHGGKINVESKEGEGSEFTIVLPADIRQL